MGSVIVGPTYSEIVKNQVEGPSGILSLSPPWFMPKYEKAKRRLVWPTALAIRFLGEESPRWLGGLWGVATLALVACPGGVGCCSASSPRRSQQW